MKINASKDLSVSCISILDVVEISDLSYKYP